MIGECNTHVGSQKICRDNNLGIIMYFNCSGPLGVVGTDKKYRVYDFSHHKLSLVKKEKHQRVYTHAQWSANLN